MKHDLERTALLVIDVQVGLDDPSLGPRNNPHCEANVAALIAAWRSAGRPVVFAGGKAALGRPPEAVLAIL